MGIDWVLSGTYGEPRGSHFHAGSDIKTNGATGYKLYAIGDGTVSRIKVSPYGYGKALYIAHPNGYTSVYGHMSSYNASIDSLVKARQYASSSFEQDIYLDAGTINVKEGDVIGYSGNSGGSAGPHLHFEIRETGNQFPLNPLLFGYKVPDTRPPYAAGITVTSVEDSYYDERFRNSYSYILQTSLKDTVRCAAGKVAIGYHGYDQQDMAGNKNGIFRIKMEVNDNTVMQWSMDKMSFDEARYVNAFRDYAENKKGKTVYNCFRLPGNEFGIYEKLENDGFIQLTKGQSADVRITASDVEGNKTVLSFVLLADREAKIADSIGYGNEYRKVLYNENSSISADGFRAFIPSMTFYDNVHLKIDRKPAASANIYSDMYLFHDGNVPMHNRAVIQVEAKAIPKGLEEKAVLVHRDLKGTEDALSTFWKDGMVSAKNNETGWYYVKLDTLAPEVVPLNYTAKTKTFRGNQIRVKISDGLSGISTYNGYINGKWVVFDYDAKKNLITYDFDEHCPKGNNKLELVVTDDVNNSTTKTVEFSNP